MWKGAKIVASEQDAGLSPMTQKPMDAPPEGAVALKGKEFRVLDKGSIVLLEFIGSDQRVVDAARVSTGVKGDPERDRKLIFFLMKNKHSTPFEHVVFQFLIKCPIFVARQWFRHRMASYNERSARYKVFEEEFYVPSLEELPEVFDEKDIEEYEAILRQEHEVYERMIEKSKPFKELRQRTREVFRGYWTINLRSLMNFVELRDAPGAQLEIRQYAQVLRSIVKEVVPISYEAFEAHVLNKPSEG